MIEPKPETLLELFEHNPERIVQNADYLAEDTNGQVVTSLDPQACRWCLIGGLEYVYRENSTIPYHRLLRTIADNSGNISCTDFLFRHSTEEIIEMIRKAGV